MATDDKFINVNDAMEKWGNPDHEESIVTACDWRTPVMKKLKERDVVGMRDVALPSLQYRLIELAHEAPDDRTRLAAASYVMAQAGQGPLQRVEHTMNYEKLPEEQLIVILKSKMEALAKLAPGFSIDRLLAAPSSDPIDAEIICDTDDSTLSAASPDPSPTPASRKKESI